MEDQPKVAVYTLTRERLDYTKECFESLRQKAGMPFVHIVVDNGSQDGTVEWLKEQKEEGLIQEVIYNETNLGLAKGCNQAVDTIFKLYPDVEFIVKFDNDCLVLSNNILVTLCNVYKKVFPTWNVFLNPEVTGKVHPVKHSSVINQGGYSLGRTNHLDGMFLVVPAFFYKNFRFDEVNTPLARGADSHISRVGCTRKFQLYQVLGATKVQHIDTTDGQARKYPEYFVRKRVEEVTVPKKNVNIENEKVAVNAKLISVIIPTYNCGKYLKDCIDSILNQLWKYIEVIVVDDGSTDNTQKVLSAYQNDARVKIITNPSNQGSNSSRNIGAASATGNFLLFMDADSVAVPSALSDLYHVLVLRKDASFSYCNFKWVGEVNRVHRAGAYSIERLKRANYIGIFGLMYSKFFVPFDLNIKRLQDWDFWLTLAESHHYGIWIDKVLFKAYSRREGISGSKNSMTYHQAAAIVRTKHSTFINSASPKRKATAIEVSLPPIPKEQRSVSMKKHTQELLRVYGAPKQKVNTSSVDKVSLIIATSGNTNDLQRCMDFIYAQNYTNLEVLVTLYGHNINKSPVILQLRAAQVYFCNGFSLAQAFNKGLSLCHSPYVCFLTDKFILKPTAIRDLMDILSERSKTEPQVVASYGAVDHIVNGGRTFELYTLDNIIQGKIPLCSLIIRHNLTGIPDVPDLYVPHALHLNLFSKKFNAVAIPNQIATSYEPYVNSKNLPQALVNICSTIQEEKPRLTKAVKPKVKPPIPAKKNVAPAKPLVSKTHTMEELMKLALPEPVDIIVCTYNNADVTIRCFDSISKYTSQYRLLWVDNASTPQDRNKVKKFLDDKKMNYVPFLNEKNLGFVKGNNLALKHLELPFTVMLNNDTRVTAHWVEKLQHCFIAHPDTGAVGPLTSTPNSMQGVIPMTRRYAKELKELPLKASEDETTFNKIIEQKYPRKAIKSRMVAFFCTMFKKEIFDKVGLLDERFGVGFADDDDYCYRINKAGYGVYIMCDTYIYHQHRTTFKQLHPNYKQMQVENIRLFKKKHNIPI